MQGGLLSTIRAPKSELPVQSSTGRGGLVKDTDRVIVDGTLCEQIVGYSGHRGHIRDGVASEVDWTDPKDAVDATKALRGGSNTD